MKLYPYLLALAVACISCNGRSGYEITGAVANADLNGKYVYLYSYDALDTTLLDSALVENRTFTFAGVQEKPSLAELCFDIYDVPLQRAPAGEVSPYTIRFILENGRLKANLSDASTVTGTPENDDWTVLRTEIRSLRQYRKKILEDTYSNDSITATQAEKQYATLEAEVTKTVEKYIDNNPGKLSTAKLLTEFANIL